MATIRNYVPSAPQFKGLGGPDNAAPPGLAGPPFPNAVVPSPPTMGRLGGLSIEAFLRLAGAVGSGPGGWLFPLVSRPLGFPSLRAGYQATALEDLALACGWHSGC